MPDYYFDIETYSKTPEPNFDNDEIIAIAYQLIDSRTGQAKDELKILKSWESNEEYILQKLYDVFSLGEKWKFVPIGYNLSFDFTSLICRWRIMGKKINARNLFANHPYIDIQPIVIMFNGGSFGGANLEKYAGKRRSGSQIKDLYENSDYATIQNYIEDEASCFLRLYQYIAQRFPSVWGEFAKDVGIIT